MDKDDALELIDEIITLIDEEVPERAWDRAASFFEDVREKVVDMSQTIHNTGRCTERQAKALEGWKAGISKWLPG